MTQTEGDTSDLQKRARAVHENAIIVDGLVYSVRLFTKEQLERFHAGSVTAVNWTAVRFNHDLPAAMLDLAGALQRLTDMSDSYTTIRSVDDIRLTKRNGKVGIILGLQNAQPLQDRIEFVRLFHALGVRIIQLTYNERNLVGDGCLEPADAGLSRFGHEVVRTMNRVGILVDLSHCGLRTTREAIDLSERPVAITHANPSAVVPNPRNKPDEILRALAARGGVAGMCAWSPMAARPHRGRPTLEEFLDILEYAVGLIGIDHVGIGTDLGESTKTREEWDQTWGPQGLYPEVTGALGSWYGFHAQHVEGLDSTASMMNLTEGLLRRGYGDADVRKILGGNFLRLFGEVWG